MKGITSSGCSCEVCVGRETNEVCASVEMRLGKKGLGEKN